MRPNDESRVSNTEFLSEQAEGLGRRGGGLDEVDLGGGGLEHAEQFEGGLAGDSRRVDADRPSGTPLQALQVGDAVPQQALALPGLDRLVVEGVEQVEEHEGLRGGGGSLQE